MRRLAIIGTTFLMISAFVATLFAALLMLNGFGYLWPHISGFWVWPAIIFSFGWPIFGLWSIWTWTMKPWEEEIGRESETSSSSGEAQNITEIS